MRAHRNVHRQTRRTPLHNWIIPRLNAGMSSVCDSREQSAMDHVLFIDPLRHGVATISLE
jgi:hypothetical protein